MEEREKLQHEVLKEMIRYSEKLIPAVQVIIEELRGDGKEDTGEFLAGIIDGINWEIEVYNQCASLINSKSSYIDKKMMVAAVTSLGKSLSSRDNAMVADCLEHDFLPFLNRLALAAKMVV